jgi:hypothetical protein
MADRIALPADATPLPEAELIALEHALYEPGWSEYDKERLLATLRALEAQHAQAVAALEKIEQVARDARLGGLTGAVIRIEGLARAAVSGARGEG